MSERLTLGMVRGTDPDTSHAAAERVLPRTLTDRERVLDCLARHPTGLDDFALAELLGGQQTSLGKRRKELVDRGWASVKVDHRGDKVRRVSPSGTPCLVWVITPAGLAAWQERQR